MNITFYVKLTMCPVLKISIIRLNEVGKLLIQSMGRCEAALEGRVSTFKGVYTLDEVRLTRGYWCRHDFTD